MDNYIVDLLDPLNYIFSSNTWLLVNKRTKNAFLIDASSEINVIKRKLLKYDANLKAVILTHGHFDHIHKLSEIKNEFNVDIFIGVDDIELLRDSDKNGSNSLILSAVKTDVEVLDIESLPSVYYHDDVNVYRSPGHTKGSYLIRFDDFLFTGDTLFENGYGRTDLYGGSGNDMLKSLMQLVEIYKNYPNIVIYPGHGETIKLINAINNIGFR